MTQEHNLKNEDRQKFAQILELVRQSRKLLAVLLQDESKAREIDALWDIYSNVEISIALARFAFEKYGSQIGVFKDLTISSKNDPSTLPLNALKQRLEKIDSSLEFAEYGFESANELKAIDSAREARDALKELLIGHRKSQSLAKRKK